MRIGVKPGQWGWTFDELTASWRAAEDAGFDTVACFDHVSAGPAGLAAWDAPTLLAAMTAHTVRCRLGVLVLNAALRHPFLLASQLAVAQAASGGRVEVGLGVGSSHLARHDHLAAGVPFPIFAERVARLERLCRVLPALWRGEEVSDPELDLRAASLGPVGIDPPVMLVGGTSDRVMDVAARLADGWNASEPDPARFREQATRIDELCQRAGRERGLEKTAQVFVRDIGWDRVRSVTDGFAEVGADGLVFVLDQDRGPAAVERLAEAVL